MKNSIDDLRLFLRIVEAGSLRQVALELRTEASTVSRRLSMLESRLGVKLIERSKVQSAPTEAGKTYYAQLRHVLAQLDTLEQQVSGTTSIPSGLLRVSCPVDFGARYLAPWLQVLQQQHTGLKIELSLSDQYVNLIEDGIDIAIRVGQLADSSLRARHLGNMPSCLVASKAYLAVHGVPQTPAQLSTHHFVLYSWLQSPNTLILRQGEQENKVTMRSNFAVNNVGAIMNVVAEGGGLHLAPRWLLDVLSDKHEFVEVLPDWQTTTYPVHALYIAPEAGEVPAKVRACIDWLVQKMPLVTE